MKQVDVTDTQVLLSPAGNRDFIHIYNNGDESIFICYDGGVGSRIINNQFGFQNTSTVDALVVKFSDIPFLRIGMSATGQGIPANIVITDIGIPFQYGTLANLPGATMSPTDLIVAISVTEFTATANNDLTTNTPFTFTGELTVDNGWPVPAGTWYALNTDGSKSIFNKEVWAIATAGPVDIRIQGE